MSVKRVCLSIVPVVILISLLFYPLATWVGMADFHFNPSNKSIGSFIDAGVHILLLVSVLQCTGILVFSVAGLLACFLGVFVQKTRVTSLKLALVMLFLFFSLFSSMGLASLVRHESLVALASRSKPLVVAIEAYKKQKGVPPADLQQLVPAFISAIPSTGMMAYPRYSYWHSNDHSTTGYRLSVYCPETVLDLGEFFYNPSPAMTDPGGELSDDWTYRR